MFRMTTHRTLGEKLRIAREKAGLSQLALAEKSGIEQPTISKIERGATAKPSFDLVAALAAACNCSLDSLAHRRRKAA